MHLARVAIIYVHMVYVISNADTDSQQGTECACHTVSSARFTQGSLHRIGYIGYPPCSSNHLCFFTQYSSRASNDMSTHFFWTACQRARFYLFILFVYLFTRKTEK